MSFSEYRGSEEFQAVKAEIEQQEADLQFFLDNTESSEASAITDEEYGYDYSPEDTTSSTNNDSNNKEETIKVEFPFTVTKQIVDCISKILNIEDIACAIDAKHLCIHSRGIKDFNSTTLTFEYTGKFKNSKMKSKFISEISDTNSRIDLNIN